MTPVPHPSRPLQPGIFDPGGSELRSMAAALAESYDQIVFLERAVGLTVGLRHPVECLEVLEEARSTMGALGAAISVCGAWLDIVPDWLRDQPRPDRPQLSVAHAAFNEGPSSVLFVPFEGSFGEGWTAFWDRPGGFGAAEVRLAQTLGRLVSSALEASAARARQARLERQAHERELANDLWREIMLDRPAALPGYVWSAHYEPARSVGGDFYVLADDWLLLGDISGKGMPAAVFACMFAAAAPLAAREKDVPAAFDRALGGDLERAGMFCTLFGAQLLADGRLRYFNLGHPPAFVRRARDGRLEALSSTAPPLGASSGDAYLVREVMLEPGDLVFAYSDGVTEARQETLEHFELFGPERLEAALERVDTPESALESVRRALDLWSVDDDLCAVAVLYRPEER